MIQRWVRIFPFSAADAGTRFPGLKAIDGIGLHDASGNLTEWNPTDTQGHVSTRHCAYGYGGRVLPHAVSAVNGATGGYAYNANGEMTHDADRVLTWAAFSKAASVVRGP